VKVKGVDSSLIIRRYPGTYNRFRFLHHAEGRPVYVTRSDFAKAKAAAQAVLVATQNHNVAWLSKTNEDAGELDRARKSIAAFSGLRLPEACADYARARSKLDAAGHKDVSVEIAVLDYIERHRGVAAKFFGQVVQELVKSKETAQEKGDLSDRYVESLRSRLGKLEKSFGLSPLSEVRDLIRSFLLELKLSLKSKANLVEAFNTLIRFAKWRNYLPASYAELRKPEVIEGKLRTKNKIQVYRPGELAELLSHADEETEPVIALGAFAGLRMAEILRLDWEDIKFKAGYIALAAEDSKTGARRTVPLLQNLRQWLPTDAAQRRGPIWNFSQAYLYERLGEVSKNSGVQWKPNALRHSFISYRLELVQNKDQVALEAGNSPAMIDSNYKALVGRDDAQGWFALLPGPGAQGLLPFAAAVPNPC
jgi:integrase